MTWGPVKDYIEKNMKVRHTAEEPIFFDRYGPEALAIILETVQNHNFAKKRRGQKLHQILIVIDDFADGPSFHMLSTPVGNTT